jgi:class 3 adenylate cyclase/CHASE2 domain-containing sensor protein
VRISARDVIVAAIVALIAGMTVASPAFDHLRGLSIDILTAVRLHAFGWVRNPTKSSVVVVALDEESYRTPPLQGTPSVAWTRELGYVMTAIIDGGAKVVGFDVIYPVSIEQSELPFGDETLGARLRGFDRDFLRALALAARDDKIVLGEIQHRDQPILPSPGQRAAVGFQRNIRALNVYNDRDDVVRRVPLYFVVDGKPTPSMAVELAARALNSTPLFSADGSMMLAGRQVRGQVPNTITLNFASGFDDIPTFSFADLATCAANGNQEFFRRVFKDKIVLIGTLLDIEDRKRTSKRFSTTPETARGERCALPGFKDAAAPISDTIAGVYVQATAINNLIRHDALTELDRRLVIAIAIVFAGFTALAAQLLGPSGASTAYVGGVLAWSAVATVAFAHALVLPLVEPAVAGFFALIVTVGYRFVVADKDKRLLRKSFALYLAPAVIEKMLTSNRIPVLGGETRTVTAFFSDIAGFSELSENKSPGELVAMMNEYLSAMTDIIEQHRGFVDKYIGDAIVAVFGAPIDDKEHAISAVHTALQCRQLLVDLNRTMFAAGSRKLAHRIGLNSGAALVGNIGSRRRFNYSVMGDMVNLASRLEGANKYFGTSIMASEATVSATGAAFVWRELDVIRVQGRFQRVKIFEPLALAGQATADQLAFAESYAEGLASWRARDFAGAAACFARFADTDPPSAAFLARAKVCVARPPGPDWEPVNVLEGK